MTTIDLTKAQLATILSALDDRLRNPANRTEALKAIAKSAERYGLTAEGVLAAAHGLLDGRLSPADFRAELGDADGDTAAAKAAQAPPDAQDDGAVATGTETTAPVAAAAQVPTTGEGQANAAGRARRRERKPTKPKGEPVNAGPAEPPTPRAGTKQALLINMLRRPDGATVEEVVEATGWQRHTVRGAISGALKKKLHLAVTSDKVEGRGRVYRIPGASAAS
jgi:hypothetical protein